MLTGRDIISISDLSIEEIFEIFGAAERLSKAVTGRGIDLLKGRVLASLFFEPSTRTRLSFESAMAKLGGTSISISDPASSSLSKGETLADTIKIIDSYSDVIVIRHPKDGAAKLASRFAEHPVINAGDGAGQHPTQTLLDLFTMWKEKKEISGLNVGIVGDLRYGRTVHSLAIALVRMGANLFLISPEELAMPSHLLRAISVESSPKISNSLERIIPNLDVVYATRIQKERFPDEAEYLKVADSYKINAKLLSKGKEDVIVMHPLPRVNEIDSEVDSTKYAKYFDQAKNGVPVRMAILSKILGEEY
jgi:aspartate carbamoyltransferase catalytic subunit